MAQYSTQDKIKVIQNSSSLGELPVDVMPYAQSDEYYFVSYSHLDYKEVYSDILRLQEQGLNIWYDRGLPAGKDWEKSAYESIIRHSCIGVIFYLSKNSLLSSAVAREIELVKELGKEYLSINLPLSENEECIPASAMLKRLQENNLIESEKERTINQSFNEKTIFIDFNASAQFKADKIKLLKRADLLTFEVVEKVKDSFTVNGNRKYILLEENANDKINYGESYARLTRVNDIDITQVTIPKTVEIGGRILPVREIGECAFANCKYLQKVEFSGSVFIGKKAFYACRSIKRLNLLFAEYVEEYAFAYCDSLEEIGGNCNIDDNAFLGCNNLKKVCLFDYFGGRIGSGNFVSGQIEEFDLSNCLDYKFRNGVLYYFSDFGWDKSAIAICGNATNNQIEIPSFINEIAKGAFAEYKELHKVNLYNAIKKIGEKAFYKCDNLKEICFKTLSENCEVEPLVFCESSFAYCSDLGAVVIPSYTVEIQNMAFLCCTSIKEIYFEDNSNLKIIGRQAFDRCSSIERLFLPDSLEDIGINAFAECSALEGVIFGENSKLKNIHAEAFAFCENLNAMILPSSLKTISKRAFYGCTKLKEINYLGTVEQFDAIKITEETAGKKIVNFLDVTTPEEKVKVVCLNGERFLEKSESISARIYDSVNHSDKQKRKI